MPTFIYKGRGEKRKVFSPLCVLEGGFIGRKLRRSFGFLHTKPKAWYHKLGEDKNLAGLMNESSALQAKTGDTLTNQINNMKNREEAVYQRYFNNCKIFEQFIDNLRNLFSERDMGKTKRFYKILDLKMPEPN